MLTYHFALKSGDLKTGLIPVTTTAKASCWEGCPFFDNGCYGLAGFHLNLHWQALSDGDRDHEIRIDDDDGIATQWNRPRLVSRRPLSAKRWLDMGG